MINKKIITDFSTVFQDGDQEDMPAGVMTVCKNLRPVNGKLCKTHGIGLKLDDSLDGLKSLVTYLESHLSGGLLYIASKIDSGTKKVTFYGWTGAAWTAIQNILGNFTGNGTGWYANAVVGNPVLQANNVMRFLPGKTSKPDGSNEGKGVWLGYLDRDFFDENYSPAAGHYNYACNVEPPVISSFVATRNPGDEAFSSSEAIPITNLSQDNDTITIAGEYASVFKSGTLFEIEFNTTNYGVYKAENSEVDSGQTVIKIDTSYKDFAGSEKLGSVRVTTSRDTRHYKFSFVYDGIQESLLSESLRVAYGDQEFLQLAVYFADTLKTAHIKRITALKVYRADLSGGPYRLIQIIDFLRPSGEYRSAADGCYGGERTIYIPGLNGVTTGDDPAGAGLIKLWSENIHDWVEKTTASYGESSTRVFFTVTTDVKEDDYWDCAWEYYADGVNLTASGSSLAFGGQKAAFISEDLADTSYAGGVLLLAGTGHYRMVNDSYKKAVHLTGTIVEGASTPSDEAWKLIKPDDGLYYAFEFDSTTRFGYVFYDTNITEDTEHPMAKEVSIRVNGDFARIIGNRLWQLDVILDPGGKGEEQADFLTYSELMQLDVNPVSNVFPLSSTGGGPGTGLLELMGNPVAMKKFSLIMINSSDTPGSPGSWREMQAQRGIGNVAESGCMEVNGKIYFCSYGGIYEVSPNNFARSDKTPPNIPKISDPIQNIWDAMTETQKEAVTVCYNQRREEVVFSLTFTIDSTDYTQNWAYNVITGAWREIVTERYFDLTAPDEHGHVMVYDDTTDKVYSLALEDTGARATFRIPVFELSPKEPKAIDWIYITYVSASDLEMRLYLENSLTPAETWTLPASSVVVTYDLRIKHYAKKASLEITEDFAGYAIIADTPLTYGYLIVARGGETNPNLEFHKLRIDHGV